MTNTQDGRPRDFLWDEFVKVHGEPASKSERGKYNATLKVLREAAVSPEEYPMLAAAYTMKYDGLQPAVATIAQRVGELRHFVARGPIRSASLEDARRAQDLAALEAEWGTDDGQEALP